MSNQLPPAHVSVKDFGKIKIHTLVTPDGMFANATHIIELPSQLILVDGHFFAQYAQQFRELADSLQKPITRFYISHDHPDHYIGMGDAFADAQVYALKEIKDAIARDGQKVLEERQQNFGPLIASKLNPPAFIVNPGEETIDGVRFLFEKLEHAESPIALVIKLPDFGVLIAQDLVYNHAHLFITGPTQSWENALIRYRDQETYTTIFAGHGEPSGKEVFDKALAYLNKATEILASAVNGNDYKTRILEAYPDYAAAGFIDIYLPFLFH